MSNTGTESQFEDTIDRLIAAGILLSFGGLGVEIKR
jgi:hypothetical protein